MNNWLLKQAHLHRSTSQLCQTPASLGHAACCPAIGQCTLHHSQQIACYQNQTASRSAHHLGMMPHWATDKPVTVVKAGQLVGCTLMQHIPHAIISKAASCHHQAAGCHHKGCRLPSQRLHAVAYPGACNAVVDKSSRVHQPVSPHVFTVPVHLTTLECTSVSVARCELSMTCPFEQAVCCS